MATPVRYASRRGDDDRPPRRPSRALWIWVVIVVLIVLGLVVFTARGR